MPTVLAQSNLPKSAAVVVSSETIILRDPNNSILEKYTSDEQKQKSLKSYGIKPATLLSPGENKTIPFDDSLVFYNWLQNVNNAYIDTGVIPLPSYRFEFSAILAGGTKGYIYGARVLSSPGTTSYRNFTGRIEIGNNNNLYYRLFWNRIGSSYLDVQNPSNNYLDIVIDKGIVYEGGESIGSIPGYSEDVEINAPIFLYAFCDELTPLFSGSVKIAYFKIYDGDGNLLRDFVPASKDEEIGMYDKVSKTLFKNKNNVGNFVAGDDETVVPSPNPFGFGNINNPDIIDNKDETI